jgi:uncharacterized protein (DUF2336 family)
MSSTRDTSLVNFRALQNEASQDRRSELLRDVTELLGLVSDPRGDNLLHVYDSVMLRLAEMVEPSARVEIAAQLAHLRRAPDGIVRKLALDEIEIAHPLLVCSPVLNDDALIGIAEIRGNAHRRAIAARPGIGEPVVRVLAERGDDSVRRVLAGNVSARFPEEAWRSLVDQAGRDSEMQELLAVHPGIPIAVLEELAAIAPERLAARIRERTARGGASRGGSVSQLFNGGEASRGRNPARSHRRQSLPDNTSG